ncbi:EF-hand domain-containing protein [Allosphingosinicella sp.]|uniref:EF-hand domain-containing protein n=1 Tax=Allosphingosinicella sp. TaxID=2823234 RepID=UPI002FC117B3
MHRNIFFATILILAAPVAAADIQQPPTDPPAGQTETPPAETSPATEGGDGFAAHDTDQNGSLNQTEFSAWARTQAWDSPPSDQDLSAVFTQADADGNGEVSASELAALKSNPQ